MNIKTHLIYWIFPSAVVLVLMAMHFSGNDTAIWMVASPAHREFGLLESLQHLLLFIMALMALRASWTAFRAKLFNARLLFAGMTLAALFIFLEEINYGVQYWMLLTGQQPEVVAHVENLNYVNLHNNGEMGDVLKDIGDIILVLLFAILPLATAKSDNPWVRFLRPSRWFIVTLICAYLASRLGHWLDDHHAPQSQYYDGAAIGEYRELFTYYIWLLYYRVITSARPWPGTESK